MAQTSAETTLGEDIHTRTTASGPESQAVVIGIDGSDSVVPAHATNGLAVQIKSPNVQAVSGDPSVSDDEEADAVTVRAGLWAHDPSQGSNARLMPLQATAAGALLVEVDGGTVAIDGTVPVSLSEPISVDDNGGSLTIDGTVTIQDGGNSITVDDGGLSLNVTVDNSSIGVNDAGSSLTVDDGGGSLTVDMTTLPAGTNNIGDVDVLSLPALPAGNNNIGDVDVASSVLPTGASTSAKQDTVIGHLDGVEGLLTTIDGDTGTLAGAVAGSEMQVDIVSAPTLTVNGSGVTQPVSHAALTELAAAIDTEVQVDIVAALPAGTNNIGDVDVLSLPALPTGTNNIGDVDVLTLPNAATATLSNVATSNVSATLLSSNAARKGAVIYNDSLVVMYVKFGTTASSTSFTYYLAAGATLELPTSPGLYTGRIDGILASSTGNARVTELT